MAELAIRTEASLREYGYLQRIIPHPSHVITEAVSHAAVRMADQIGATAIVSLTETGFTSRLISKHRPECPILAVTSFPKVARRLCLNWGVVPTLYRGKQTDDAKIAFAIKTASERGLVKPGDNLVITASHSETTSGTNMIRVLTVEP
jgi:pyruvate kinase